MEKTRFIFHKYYYYIDMMSICFNFDTVFVSALHTYTKYYNKSILFICVQFGNIRDRLTPYRITIHTYVVDIYQGA